MKPPQGNFYRILGATPGDSQEEIKRAYHRLAKRYHSDLTGNPNDDEKMKVINEAFGTLNDLKLKAVYDLYWQKKYGDTIKQHKTNPKVNKPTSSSSARSNPQTRPIYTKKETPPKSNVGDNFSNQGQQSPFTPPRSSSSGPKPTSSFTTSKSQGTNQQSTAVPPKTNSYQPRAFTDSSSDSNQGDLPKYKPIDYRPRLKTIVFVVMAIGSGLFGICLLGSLLPNSTYANNHPWTFVVSFVAIDLLGYLTLLITPGKSKWAIRSATTVMISGLVALVIAIGPLMAGYISFTGVYIPYILTIVFPFVVSLLALIPQAIVCRQK